MLTPRVMAAVFSLLVVASAFAGPITPPPGPVASTHKTLTEVEPRTAINAANTPGDADSVFKITASGSYYLTGNVSGGNGRHGIEIAASGVTLDLNGFALLGGAGSLDAVTTEGVQDRITIRDGTISGWGSDGINLTTGGNGSGSLIRGVQATGNGSFGIRANFGAVVQSCTAIGNGGMGISVPGRGVVKDCAAHQNGSTGIFAVNSVVTGCAVQGNAGGGIFAGAGGGGGGNASSTITECHARENAGSGIVAAAGSTVTGCTVLANAEHGISVAGDSVVRGNTCSFNGTDGFGAGIFCNGADTRIEGNNCTDNDWGIRAVSAGNFITRNTCSGNTSLNWDIVSGNVCLVVSASVSGAIAGNSGGVAPGSTDPNANFTY